MLNTKEYDIKYRNNFENANLRFRIKYKNNIENVTLGFTAIEKK